MKILIAVALLLILSVASYAGTRNPSVPDSKHIEYGKDFNCVLNIAGVCNDNTLFSASSVAIKPRWIVTAAHVLKDAKHCGIHTDDGVIIVQRMFTHKTYDKIFGDGDIALCYLEADLDVKFFPQLYETKDEVGKICSIAGYGLYGTFLTGATGSDCNRRAGSNIIDKTYRDLLICSPSRGGTDRITSLEFLIGSGDSGGGLFIDGKLAGINSCVMASHRSPMSKYDEEAGHTRISTFVPWILETIKSVEE